MTDQVQRDETDPAPLDAASDTPPAKPTPPATDDPTWAPPDAATTSAAPASKPSRPVKPVVPVVRRNAPTPGNGGPGGPAGWPYSHPGQPGHAGQRGVAGRQGQPYAPPPRPPSVRSVPANWRVVPLAPAGPPGYAGPAGYAGQPYPPAWPAPNGVRVNGVTHANGWPRSTAVDPWQRFVSAGRPAYREPYPVRAKALWAGLGAGALWFLTFGAVSWSARSYAWTAVVAGVLAALAAVVLTRFGDRGVAIGVTIATAVGLGVAGIVVTAYAFGGTWLFW